MFRPLEFLLHRMVRTGDLTVMDAGGQLHRFGDGSGPSVRVRLTDRAFERWLAFDPELAGGEGYMQGRLVVEGGSIYDLVAMIAESIGAGGVPGMGAALEQLRQLRRHWDQHNPRRRSRANVHHHYDIDPRIYDLFLDRDRQYSCAYFSPGIDLDQAQADKKRHIAAKLALEAGHRVLDIGSGWGGLALFLARTHGTEVTGVTLSERQLASARARAHAEHVDDRVKFDLVDYRDLAGPYDRIVSVGMFEHVGVGHYRDFFAKIRDLLAPDGVALLHTIGRADRPAATNPFIAKHIFPGGYIPALSEIVAAVEDCGLIISDIEVLRLHYAETLRAWRQRFMARRAEAVAISGEEFARMWEFYLAGSEAAFRFQNLVVFQLQLTRRIDVLPIRRDYMTAAEQRHADAPDLVGV